MTDDSIFKMSVPDWEYLAFFAANLTQRGKKVDFLAMIYKDGTPKCTGRIKFPSGDSMKFDRKFPKDADIFWIHDTLLDLVKNFPGLEFLDSLIIENTTTKGQDLFKALIKSGKIKLSIEEERL